MHGKIDVSGSHAVVIAPVNSEEVLRSNLASSPCITAGRFALHAVRGAPSAAVAYNLAIDATSAPLLIFAHQDIYFPKGWDEALLEAIATIERSDPDWGVIGVWGITPTGAFAGKVYCNGGGVEHVGIPGITPVCSIDEIIIVTRRASGLRFDDGLPGFHMYATDLCLTSKARDMGCYAIEAPVVHNSAGRWLVDQTFWDAYWFMRRKWRHQLPIRTCVTTITPMALHMRLRQLRVRIAHMRGRIPLRHRHADPMRLAAELSYDRASPVAERHDGMK